MLWTVRRKAGALCRHHEHAQPRLRPHGAGRSDGLKNLKAIAVRGSQRPPVADPTGVKSVAAAGAAQFKANRGMQELGELARQGLWRTRTWPAGCRRATTRAAFLKTLKRSPANGGRDDPDRLATLATPASCAVSARWRAKSTTSSANWAGRSTRPSPRFGSYCGVNDLEAVSKANEICNDYGIDTISAGATIAWAMECFEDGLLTLRTRAASTCAGAMRRPWSRALEVLAFRRGSLGDLLAEGRHGAAATLGPDAQVRLITVKGRRPRRTCRRSSAAWP